jgi:hypothetical protein
MNKNKVRIIAQSEVFSTAEIVDEDKAEKRLQKISELYTGIVASNKRRNDKFEDNGLLVTTTLIKS